MKHLIKKLSAIGLSLMMMLTIPTQAFAETAIEVDRTCSLEVSFVPEGTAAADVEFRIYQVADVDSYTNFQAVGAFADYPISLAGHDADSWRKLAATLKGYVAADSIAPAAVGKTDAQGRLRFEKLTTGLYLVLGDSFQTGRTTYTPEATLVSLPTQDAAHQWDYDLSISVKKGPVPTGPISVLKVWSDNNSSSRPAEVTVSLYKGSTLHETVKLNKENNWQHTWSDLEKASDWSIVEKNVPKGYTVAVEQQGTRFVVTNTHGNPKPATPDQKLPQTGQLWWPVPLLAVLGMIAVACGAVLLKRRANDEK